MPFPEWLNLRLEADCGSGCALVWHHLPGTAHVAETEMTHSWRQNGEKENGVHSVLEPYQENQVQ